MYKSKRFADLWELAAVVLLVWTAFLINGSTILVISPDGAHYLAYAHYLATKLVGHALPPFHITPHLAWSALEEYRPYLDQLMQTYFSTPVAPDAIYIYPFLYPLLLAVFCVLGISLNFLPHLQVALGTLALACTMYLLRSKVRPIFAGLSFAIPLLIELHFANYLLTEFLATSVLIVLAGMLCWPRQQKCPCLHIFMVGTLAAIAILLRTALSPFALTPLALVYFHRRRCPPTRSLPFAVLSIAPLFLTATWNYQLNSQFSTSPTPQFPIFAMSLLIGHTETIPGDPADLAQFIKLANQVKAPTVGSEKDFAENIQDHYAQDDWGNNGWRIFSIIRLKWGWSVPQIYGHAVSYMKRVRFLDSVNYFKIVGYGLQRAFGLAHIVILLILGISLLKMHRYPANETIATGSTLFAAAHVLYLTSIPFVGYVIPRYIEVTLGIICALVSMSLIVLIAPTQREEK
ncbi:MAG: hypothetical protein K1X79_08510 [Oligoflexia bacterium]|nr:hypothetical protein [Oligoflexia bacterium]